MFDDADLATTVPSYAQLTLTHPWKRPVGPVKASRGSLSGSGFRYREEDLLGAGGMGKVLLARDARVGRDVALKVLHSDQTLSAEDRARFLREAQVQGQLEHPSIVPVYDIDTTPDGQVFFTMRRVLGKTLEAILAEQRAGTAHHTRRELLQAFATVCLTLDYAHSRGVVHRDLKPANIMLGDFGEVYVLDWGLARVLDDGDVTPVRASRLSSPGETLGTPLYMAPEQMLDGEVGPLADVYSLGAILFELLALERLRTAQTLIEGADARFSVRVPDRDIPTELEAICVRATEHFAADRFASARELHDAIARYLDGDRELAQRRRLAAEHAARAREALARAEAATPADESPATSWRVPTASGNPEGDATADAARGEAMRELQRALLLEPNREHVAMLAEIMSTPPRATPPEVAEAIELSRQAVARSGAVYAAVATLSWFVFLPGIALLGVRDYSLLAWVAIPALITVALGLVASRQRRIGRAIQLTMAATWFIAAMGLSRLFSPLVLMPTVLAAFAIVAQAHPDRVVRIASLVGAALCVALPVGLELLGVLPSSLAFTADGVLVLPQMTDLPASPTLAFAVLANAGVTVLPAVFVAGLRNDLTRSQERQILHTWHFRRLGEDLLDHA